MGNRALAVGISILCMFLLSCGGGGGGSSTPQPQPPTPTPTPPAAVTLNVAFGLKQLRFSWTASAGATSYRLLENPDGISGFAAVGNALPEGSTSTVREIAVHRHNWQAARYALDACNAVGCSRSAAVTTTQGMLATIGYVKASNPGATDYFAASMALSADGNTLAIGAVDEDSNAVGIGGDQANDLGTASGAAYVFTRAAGVWSQQAYVKASNSGVADQFGWAVALSGDGNTMAVGSYNEDSNAVGVGGDQINNSVTEAGAVYVFTRTNGVWSQQAYVKASHTSSGAQFGEALALSLDGDTLAVGASGDHSNATGIDGNQTNFLAIQSGAAYVFTRTSGVWSQQAYIKASNTEARDRFGVQLTLSGDGNTLAVDAWLEDSNATGIGGNQADNSAADSGAVYLFKRAGPMWSQEAYVKGSNTEAGDYFGYSLALSDDGNTLAAGARLEASNATGVGGDQMSNLAAGAGAAYVFARTGGAWSQQAYVKASNPEADDQFGWSVALSGNGDTMAVGALFEDGSSKGIGGDQANNFVGGAGAVYLFARTVGSWSQQAYVKAPNPGVDDHFGELVSLSSDGNTLAVGAIGEDSNAAGIGGDQTNNSADGAGAVFLH